jgi:microcystin-dependent protein
LKLTGNGQPHNNMPPFLSVYFIIALQGVYPTRN